MSEDTVYSVATICGRRIGTYVDYDIPDSFYVSFCDVAPDEAFVAVTGVAPIDGVYPVVQANFDSGILEIYIMIDVEQPSFSGDLVEILSKMPKVSDHE